MRFLLVGLVVISSLLLPTPGQGQPAETPDGRPGPSLYLLGGGVSYHPLLPFTGYHVGAIVTQPVWGAVAFRGEAVLAGGDVRGLAGLGSLEIDLLRELYAVVGAGVYYDNGTNLAVGWGLGSGIQLGPHRIGVELRYLSMQDGGIYWSVRKAIP